MGNSLVSKALSSRCNALPPPKSSPKPIKKPKLAFEIVKDREEDLILIHDSDLTNELRGLFKSESFYNKVVKFPIAWLFRYYDQIQDSDLDYYSGFSTFIKDYFKDNVNKLNDMINDGHINYDSLWYYLKPEKEALFYIDEEPVGCIIMGAEYQQSFFGNYFMVRAKVLKTNGKNLAFAQEQIAIREFHGMEEIKRLPVRLLDEETKKILIERGKSFLKYATGSHYLFYDGIITYRSWWNDRKYRATGRVMVDWTSFNMINTEYDRGSYVDDDSGSPTPYTLSENNYHLTHPFLRGFSFFSKQWGEIKVSGLKEIKFRKDAFSKLVLDEDKKGWIKSLVENSRNSFQDLISGKGGGCIFLLHGEPGTGKTLSAESVAELLERPLYSISVGELGTDPKQLEDRLKEILDLATAWNAVVLIDEADIFLEKRTKQDIVRNAMVGVFLRLLEYHQGVLFLTTNRVEEFDEAFHSRISVALHYKPLDGKARRKVWENLISSATGFDEISEKQLDELQKIVLNGRQIKNSVRLAQTMAVSLKEKPGYEHLRRAVDFTLNFKKDLEEKDMPF